MQTSEKVTIVLYRIYANQGILSYKFFRILNEQSPTIHIIFLLYLKWYL